MAEPSFDPSLAAGSANGAGEGPPQPAQVVGVDQIDVVAADEILPGVAEDAFDGRADGANGAGRVEDGDDVGGAADEGAIAVVVLPQGGFHPLALGDVLHLTDYLRRLSVGVSQNRG